MSQASRQTFRSWPKRNLRALVPEELEKAVNLRVAETGRPGNEVVTEALSRGLGIDPARFGIEMSSAAVGAT